LYVPNLIGYFRLITGVAALYFAPFNQNPNKNTSYFLALYFVSYMADALDGTAARALNQTSKFGQVSHFSLKGFRCPTILQVLDMVTDRSCSAGLLCVLSHKFPQHALLFVLLIGLDMCSHYTSM
jgi:CDP-diacylglycerol--inositol 3-phosphatidyltransferase